MTVGERVADMVARFGGSWTFIIIFFTFLLGWMGVNAAWLLAAPPDPYPYIFLNLILSCIAALQAPVIMMSQNRQATKDRPPGRPGLRGEHQGGIRDPAVASQARRDARGPHPAPARRGRPLAQVRSRTQRVPNLKPAAGAVVECPDDRRRRP